jgi:hypothetical protein
MTKKIQLTRPSRRNELLSIFTGLFNPGTLTSSDHELVSVVLSKKYASSSKEDFS